MKRWLQIVLTLWFSTAAGASPTAPECPATFAQRAPSEIAPCRCVAASLTGPVWGTQAFTGGSSVCRAAIHAGVIDARGGEVVYAVARGCKAYTGRTRNGVKSGSHASHDLSYYFPSHQSGRCGGRVVGTPCPTNYTSVAHVRGDFTCACDASMVVGRVEGDGVYSGDSPICAAAVHAGALPDAGGTVTVRPGPNCFGHRGVTRNGITSHRAPETRLSFFFPAQGPARCVRR